MLGAANKPETLRMEATRSQAPKWHGLDNLRALAMLLGVVVHAVLPFVVEPGADVWPARNAEKGQLFDLIGGLIHAWRMQLFFLLAGFFGHLAHERYGSRGFLRQRALRIGVPFAVGMVTVAPLVWQQWNYGIGSGATVHLWFLQYLILYSIAAAALAGLEWPGSIHRAARFLIGSNWRALWCAIPTAALMAWSPIWDETANARGATFLPNGLALIYFGLFFAFGWMLHRHSDLLHALQRRVTVHFVLAIGLLLGWGILFRAQREGSWEYPVVAWPIYLIAGSANAWCFCFAFLGLFLGKLNVESNPIRYLADASYWIYLAHLPLVIALQQWLIPQPLGPWTKFLLINLAAFAVLIASYHWCVRFTRIGALLNGPRRQPR